MKPTFSLTPVCKIAVLIAIELLLGNTSANSQVTNGNIAKLPVNLTLREERPVSYHVVTDYLSQEIFGSFSSKTRVKGRYTRGLPGGKVQWNNVSIADGRSNDDQFTEGIKQNYMENFTYQPTANIIDNTFFKGFPEDSMQGKALIWDVYTFEQYGWKNFDNLKLNIPYHAREFNTSIQLGGSGSFVHKDVTLTWTSTSLINGKPCALIQFEAIGNAVNIKTTGMDAKGRSHYWGDIWVNLNNKQLEGAWMNEDVVMEVNFKGNKQLINIIKKVTLEKTDD